MLFQQMFTTSTHFSIFTFQIKLQTVGTNRLPSTFEDELPNKPPDKAVEFERPTKPPDRDVKLELPTKRPDKAAELERTTEKTIELELPTKPPRRFEQAQAPKGEALALISPSRS